MEASTSARSRVDKNRGPVGDLIVVMDRRGLGTQTGVRVGSGTDGDDGELIPFVSKSDDTQW